MKGAYTAGTEARNRVPCGAVSGFRLACPWVVSFAALALGRYYRTAQERKAVSSGAQG